MWKAECKSETGILVQVCCHPETCCIPAFFAFDCKFTNLKNQIEPLSPPPVVSVGQFQNPVIQREGDP